MYPPGEFVVEQCPQRQRDPEELRLVRAVLAGDLSAFDHLVERHARSVTSVVRRVLDDPNELEDAVQETFIRAFQNLRRFRGEASLRTWLLRIAVNVCEDRRRGFWRRVTLWDGVTHLRNASAQLPPPENGFQEALGLALRELPDRLRIPFTLHVLEELTGAEVAAVLGVNESTVWSRVYAARKLLRKKLASEQEGV